jgi:hypothetical protein
LWSFLFLISDIPQQAHAMSLPGAKIGSPTQEVGDGDEPSAVSKWTFDGRVSGPIWQ